VARALAIEMVVDGADTHGDVLGRLASGPATAAVFGRFVTR
jgi:hypothetical protein